MRQALELSLRGPATGVNPRVGCVILDPSGRVIAEGWHLGAGTPHAEIVALRSLPAGGAAGATVVVTLEPCNHVGRTGPCSEALIEAGVSRVVYGVGDPGYASRGGADRLRSAGIEVTSGVLADEIGALLDDWLVAARLGRPFVSLKWASSLDGRIAAADGSSRWITGTTARQRVHEQREASDAIVVGIGTILADDPSLTARGDAGELLSTQPVPVVIGLRDVPADAAIGRHPHAFVHVRTHDVREALGDLHRRGFRRVYVEGGPALSSAFIAAGLVDEYFVFLAPTLVGGPRTAVGDIGVNTLDDQRRLTIDRVEILGPDLLVVAHPAAEPRRNGTAPAAVSSGAERSGSPAPRRPEVALADRSAGEVEGD